MHFELLIFTLYGHVSKTPGPVESVHFLTTAIRRHIDQEHRHSYVIIQLRLVLLVCLGAHDENKESLSKWQHLSVLHAIYLQPTYITSYSQEEYRTQDHS